MKNSAEGFMARFEQANELVNFKIGYLKLSTVSDKKKKRLGGSEPSLRDLCDTINCTSVFIIKCSVPKGEERERERKGQRERQLSG